jgi:hypothetical protein
MTLQSVRIKPNPFGKDRSKRGASAIQLAAEWVDMKNVTSGTLDLSGVFVRHIGYSPAHPSGQWDVVFQFPKGSTLKAGEIVRIHSGKQTNIAMINQNDVDGANWHYFTGVDNYVWNNDKNDCVNLSMSLPTTHFDQACYAAPVAEGAILIRNGDRLS